MLNSNTGNHLTVCKQTRSGSLKMLPTNYSFTNCWEQYWTSPGGNTQQGTNYTATYLPSRKLSKFDEPDMQDTSEEAGTSS